MGNISLTHLNANGTLGITGKKTVLYTLFALMGITLMVYMPSLKNDFVNWDDYEYVYQNRHIQELSLQSLKWMFTEFHSANWHPLTWLSHAIDYALFQLKPAGHHFTNILLHAMNTGIVFFLSLQLTLLGFKQKKATPAPLPGKTLFYHTLLIASITAGFFGLHPIHVESVAWISERKDVLCAFFFLLCLCLYLASKNSSEQKQKLKYYMLCLFSFACALMSKPMAVSLPIILLLLDYYPLQRLKISWEKLKPVIIEKIPFVALSVTSCLITMSAQENAMHSFSRMPFLYRFFNAIESLLFYLQKMVWPLELSPFYPLPRMIELVNPRYLTASIVILLLTGFCIFRAIKNKPLCLAVWSYYVILLLPVLGLVQVGMQAAADRYMYLPSVSIFLGLSLVLYHLALPFLDFSILRKAVILGLLVFFTLLSSLTIQQIKVWRNTESLWLHTIGIFPNQVSFAYSNLAKIYKDKENTDKAYHYYQKALAIDPKDEKTLTNFGIFYADLGKLDKATQLYQKSIQINPLFADSYTNLGAALSQQGKHEEAEKVLNQAIDLDEESVMALTNLGSLYSETGRLNQAILKHKMAISKDPLFVLAHTNLGVAYGLSGNTQEAITAFEHATTLDSDDPFIFANLGYAYLQGKMYQKAQQAYQNAKNLDPENPKHDLKLCLVNAHLNNWLQVKISSEYILKTNPNHEEAKTWLKRALHFIEKKQESIPANH